MGIATRALGATGLSVSEVGFGAWAIGGTRYGPVSRTDAVEAIHAYAEAGGNLIDTAPGYGDSEEIIGSILPSLPDEMTVVSKSPSTGGQADHPRIREDLVASLRRLRLDHIDVYLMHHPPLDPGLRDAAIEQMQRLRDEGMIGYVGASIAGPSVSDVTVKMCEEYVATGAIDVVEVIISPLRQLLVQSKVVDRCAEAGVGVLARTALESGFLSGRYPASHEFPDDDHRSRWSPTSRQRIDAALEELQILCANVPGSPDSLIELGARFPLTYPGVSSILLGGRSAAQTAANVATVSKGPLPAGLQERLEGWGSGRTEDFNPDSA